MHNSRRGWNRHDGRAVPDNAVGSVDVRGGGPGTRETICCTRRPPCRRCTHCATGGAYGFGCNSWVMAFPRNAASVSRSVSRCRPRGANRSSRRHLRSRSRRFGNRPDESFVAVQQRRLARPFDNGAIRAGAAPAPRGCKTDWYASTVLPNGVVVSALAVVNSAGTVIDPATGLPDARYMSAVTFCIRQTRCGTRAATPPLNTTIGVVATTARSQG